jgi:dATP pyrophosphohydrolase
MRAPFQVLIIPFLRDPEGIRYGILKRADTGWWQFIAGGGEDDETALEAAERETMEETGIDARGRLLRLDAMASVPRDVFSASREWPPDIHAVPEYCFAVEVEVRVATLSSEHVDMRWVDYDEAVRLLEWESNRNALRELNERLERPGR